MVSRKIHVHRIGAWNLPPAMHRLSYLAGATAVLYAVLTLTYGAHWPLVARLPLGYTAAVGLLVAAAASTRRSAHLCRRMFFKNTTTGLIPWPAVALLAPYHLTVFAVCFFYRSSSGENIWDKIADRLYLGGWPLNKTMLPTPDCAILDITNELIRWVRAAAYRPVLCFESWAPEPDDMNAAVEWALEQQAAGRSVYVHCTHGHGRSAVTAAAILIAMGQAGSAEEALVKTIQARPGVKPNYRQISMLQEWAARYARKGSSSSNTSGS